MRFDDVTVIYDLDGTLVDTAPDLVRALNAVLAEEGYAPVPLPQVRGLVGRGARALLARAYARVGTSYPEPALDSRVARFIDVYAEDIARVSRPFPGMEAALDRFAAAGAVQVVATNKPQRLTDLLLDALGMTGRFARVVGADSAPRKKPDASHLAAAAGGEKALGRAVMIGDSEIDVAAARAAGVPVVVMSHGYADGDANALGADLVIDHFDDLEGAVFSVLQTR